MKSTEIAVELLLLASGAVAALPEIGVSKRDASLAQVSARVHAKRSLDKRQGTLETNIFDILTYSTGGAYYANLTVGTPPQQQVVILDTGSSDLYFDASTAPSCQGTSSPFSCRGGSFNPQNSNSYHVVAQSPAFNTSFGDGSTAVGPFSADTVCIGDVCVDNVQFGVAEEVNSTTGYAIGLMGVGYSENEATMHEYPNMPEVLKDAGVINSRLYSVYLNDEGAMSGTILFGGIDTSKYTGTLQTVDTLPDINTGEVDQFVTTVTALSANVGGQSTNIFNGGSPGVQAYQQGDTALPVLLDTGSSAWSVPTSYYKYIASAFPYVDDQGTCSCKYADSADTVTLTFAASLDITVPARDFIVPIYNATTNQPVPYSSAGDLACAFMIVPAQPTGQGFQTLGDAVLRSMYVVFDLDNGQMALAQAKVNSTATPDIKTVSAGPSGIASAVSSSVSSAPSQSYSVAAEINATASFVVSTAQSTIGSATGTAAVPADALPGASGASGSSSGSGGSSSSSAAASGLVIPPAMDWSRVWTVGWVVVMAGLGMGIML